MITTKEIEKKIKDKYPNGVKLNYVDYNDNLNEYKKEMEELAQTGFIDSLFEGDWFYEDQYEAIEYLKKEIFNEEEQEEINNNNDLRQAMEETLYSIDTSDVVKDYLKNTNRRFFYYDLGFEIEENNKETAKIIAKKLHISYKKNKEKLDELADNAYYGGQLVLLFTTDPINFLGEKKEKYIKFKKNFDLCIMDRGNGSGHSVNFNEELTLEFKRENLHDDEGDNGYNFSNDVCGLCMFDEAIYSITDKINKSDKIITVETNKEADEFRASEREYEKIYQSGKCSFGDMKYTRHRNLEYINIFPCGNKCKDCGTFFID